MWFTLLSFVGLGHTLPESQILLIPSVTPARGMLELGTRSRELEWDGSMVRAFTPHPMALGAPQIPPTGDKPHQQRENNTKSWSRE